MREMKYRNIFKWWEIYKPCKGEAISNKLTSNFALKSVINRVKENKQKQRQKKQRLHKKVSDESQIKNTKRNGVVIDLTHD